MKTYKEGVQRLQIQEGVQRLQIQEGVQRLQIQEGIDVMAGVDYPELDLSVFRARDFGAIFVRSYQLIPSFCL